MAVSETCMVSAKTHSEYNKGLEKSNAMGEVLLSVIDEFTYNSYIKLFDTCLVTVEVCRTKVTIVLSTGGWMLAVGSGLERIFTE